MLHGVEQASQAEFEAFLKAERAKVLSDNEWRFRLRGFGYNLRRTDAGVEVARLPRGELVGVFAV